MSGIGDGATLKDSCWPEKTSEKLLMLNASASLRPATMLGSYYQHDINSDILKLSLGKQRLKNYYKKTKQYTWFPGDNHCF